jgi:hypothetical protein
VRRGFKGFVSFSRFRAIQLETLGEHMNELLFAVKAYVASCNIDRPKFVGQSRGNIAWDTRSTQPPAEKARAQASVAKVKTQQLSDCEVATNKMLDLAGERLTSKPKMLQAHLPVRSVAPVPAHSPVPAPHHSLAPAPIHAQPAHVSHSPSPEPSSGKGWIRDPHKGVLVLKP